MFARTLVTGLVAVATSSAIALTAGSASAAIVTDPDDTTGFTPTGSTIIGVGSDTSQHAVKLLADSWNATAPTTKLFTYAATSGGEIDLPTADITRPNGSGAGKALLYGAGDNTDIDFARSSSGPSTTEVAAGLQSFPFALDTLKMAVSGNVTSNAPASLTIDQIVDIYDGTANSWDDVGGSSTAAIEPKIPQAGSGTRSFFLAQLKAANGGVDVVLAGTVAEVQEHDDTAIKGNANAIAPFSAGRAGLLGSTLHLEGGWKADRALYNVVRGTALANADIQAIFGEDGFVCSIDARDEIEAAGFKQLATPANGGVCGEATQTATTNFTLNEAVVTTTALSAENTKPGKVKLTATVTGGGSAPDGTVEFLEDGVSLAANVPLVSSQASQTFATAPGDHDYEAVFTPTGGTPYLESGDTASATVKAGSSVAESFPAKTSGKATGTVTVTLKGIDRTASGKVVVKRGKKVLEQKALNSSGKAKITLAAGDLDKGKNKLTASWKGNKVAFGSKTSFTITKK